VLASSRMVGLADQYELNEAHCRLSERHCLLPWLVPPPANPHSCTVAGLFRDRRPEGASWARHDIAARQVLHDQVQVVLVLFHAHSGNECRPHASSTCACLRTASRRALSTRTLHIHRACTSAMQPPSSPARAACRPPMPRGPLAHGSLGGAAG